MQLRSFLLFVVLLLTNHLNGQQLWLSDGLSSIESVDVEVLAPQDNKKLQATVRSLPDEPRPLKFAKSISTKLSTQKRGTWESVPGDREVWRMRIQSPEAFSINLGFSNFYLPPSAVMFLSDAEQSHVIGPLTSQDNEEHKQWWSPIIPGDYVIIEIQIDSDEKSRLSAQLSTVNHDFAGFGAILSGSCNIDVICDENDGLGLINQYRDIINSVGMYSIGGTDLCSGALINTTSNNCTPYFLTAFHCEVGQVEAPSVVVYWNYENSVCRTPGSAASGGNGNGTRTNFNSGSRLISEFDVTDFTLLLLDDDVNPDYNPFYSGWNVEGEVFDTTLSIHHPNSEEKRISFDFDQSEPFADNVFMRVNNWELGTTEGGSSGSPLYNTNKEIIGQLTGGLAACGNTQFDDYGMLKLSWEGGGTPTTRLRDWLDPDNTGRLTLTGRSCVNVASVCPSSLSICKSDNSIATLIIQVQSGYENGATVQLSDVPSNIMATLSSNQLTTEQPIEVSIDISQLDEDFDGTISILLDDGYSIVENSIAVSLDAAVPGLPPLRSPANATDDINFDLDLVWEETGDRSNVQIATDRSFNEIAFESFGVFGNTLSVKGLDANSTYYWRVSSLNDCGESPFSEVFSFSTGNIACTQSVATDGPQTILNESNIVRSVINITDDLIIADVNVLNVTGTHSWVADLEFRLTGPDGTTVDLLINGCENEDNFNVSFDDESEVIILACPFTDGTAYKPSEPLDVFDGTSSLGDWTLEITDDVFLDGGSFDVWTLELCLVSEKVARSLRVSLDNIAICEKSFENQLIEIDLSGDFDAMVTVELQDSESNTIGEPVSSRSDETIEIFLDDISSLVDQENSSINVVVRDEEGVLTVSIPIKVQSDNLFITLVSPAHSAINIDREPTLSWQEAPDAISYRIEVFDSLGSGAIIDTTVRDIDSLVISTRLDQLTLYQWRVTVAGECSPDFITETFTFRTMQTVSTFDISESDISIYPNPVSEKLLIDKESRWKQSAQFKLYNSQGIMVRDIPIIGELQTVDVSDLSVGAYFYEVIEDQNRYIQRLIISR